MSNCVILIGMPGAGKSTIGSKLADLCHFAFIDTDLVIESVFGIRLQDIADQLAAEEFRDIESRVVCSLSASRSIIATGGSVIYREAAMRHLKSLGSIIHLVSPLADIKSRIENKPERGICFKPNQTLEDIYNERMTLYRTYASYECDTGLLNPDECTRWIARQLKLPVQ